MIACHKERPQEETPASSDEMGEGIYLGVIGFNNQLYVKNIGILNNSTYGEFNGFIDQLALSDGTALYYADYIALKKMREYSKPPKLKNVALVTFTDGLDNISLANGEYNPEGYQNTSDYREALHNKIMYEQVHGLNVSAYSIGLKGGDVSDEAQFMETLRKLASGDNNVFQVSNMNEAMQRFSEIATGLYSVSTSVNLGVNLPGGYDEGQQLRFTFDNVNAALSSTKYIQATYRRTSSDSRTLDNITYYGFTQGATSIASSSLQGAYYQFLFENLTYTNGNSVSQSDINMIKLWKQTSTGAWDKETEFNPASSTTITEDKNSALIMLVLDCSSSLGSDFANLKQSARRFVNTLANVNDGGGSGSGGGTGNVVLPTVTTNTPSSVTSTTAVCGGNVTADGGATVTARGVCWSTSQNPTISNSHTTNGSGTGSFTSNMTGLSPNTTYYVKAYATNSQGTSYGAQRTFTTSSNCPSTVTDYDGNTYSTVQIGSQCWMKQNLRTTHYANGTSIALGIGTSSTTTAYRYYPNNSSSNVSTYGYLYNWKAVMRNSSSSSANPSGVQGICPNGWHVPSDAEWTQLTNYVGNQTQYQCGSSSTKIAKALASTTGWSSSSTTCAVGNNPSSNNSTGFSALPAGCYNGSNNSIFGYAAYFWSATEDYDLVAYALSLLCNYAYVDRGDGLMGDGFSVRCVRD